MSKKGDGTRVGRARATGCLADSTDQDQVRRGRQEQAQKYPEDGQGQGLEYLRGEEPRCREVLLLRYVCRQQELRLRAYHRGGDGWQERPREPSAGLQHLQQEHGYPEHGRVQEHLLHRSTRILCHNVIFLDIKWMAFYLLFNMNSHFQITLIGIFH